MDLYGNLFSEATWQAMERLPVIPLMQASRAIEPPMPRLAPRAESYPAGRRNDEPYATRRFTDGRGVREDRRMHEISLSTASARHGQLGRAGQPT